MNEHRPYSREVLLGSEQWGVMSERSGLQYGYNHSQKNHRQYDVLLSTLFQYVEKIIANELTCRQQQVMLLYFFKQRTQACIAEALGITQPTVNQHIHGKRRNGKHVGGAHAKIRKSLWCQAHRSNCSPTDQSILTTIYRILDPKTSRRHAIRFLRLINESKFNRNSP